MKKITTIMIGVALMVNLNLNAQCVQKAVC